MVACIYNATKPCFTGALTSHRIQYDLNVHMKFMWQVIHKRRDQEREVSQESVKDDIMKNDFKLQPQGLSPKVKLGVSHA